MMTCKKTEAVYRAEIEFECPRCGLLSPAICEVPLSHAGKIRAEHKCFHCGAKLFKVFDVKDFADAV